MEIIRLHYQRGGFDLLKKHSLARNLSSAVSIHEKAGMIMRFHEVSDCHSSLCSWCMSQEAHKSTAAASMFLLLTRRFTDIVVSIIRSSKSIIVSESFAAETESVSCFLSAWYVMSQLHMERRWLAVYRVHRVLFASSAAAFWLAPISVTSVAICRPLINAT